MKPLRLEAFSPTEGIGIVRSGDDLRLIRPPYSLRSSPILEEASLLDAIQRAGFVVSHEEFKDWNEIIQFLNDQLVQSRKQLGYEIPDDIRAEDVFDIATFDALTGLLDRIEGEFLSKHQFDVAENILVSFLAHESSHRFSELGIRAARILKNLTLMRQSRIEACKLGMTDARFPSLRSHGTYGEWFEVSEKIRARGSVFSLVS